MNESRQVYEELSRLAGALASPLRLRALHLLFQRPRALDELAAELGASEANTGAHMKVLREAGLVAAERRGKYVIQSPSGEATLRLFLALREAGEAVLPELRLLEAGGRDEAVSPHSPESLERALGGGRRPALLADLRPAREYRAGHLPGAVSFPFEELEQRAGALSQRRRILVYCRGKYCPKARDGAERLRARGLRAERLSFGVPEWLGSGRALEVPA